MRKAARRVVLVMAALVALAPSWAADCPADGAARRLGRRQRLERDAALAAASGAPRCVLAGLALADFLDLDPGAGACAAAARLGDADVDLPAFRAALEWRCGRPRRAHADALAAIADDPEAALGWLVLARVLAARFHFTAAEKAAERVVRLAPTSAAGWFTLANVVADRQRRREALAAYLDVAAAEREPPERIAGARDNLRLIEALGDRPVWVVEKRALPGALPLEPLAGRPGHVRGWLVEIALDERRRVPALLDSGASGLHLAPTALRRVPMETLTRGTLFGGGGSGTHAIVRGLLDRLRLGPLTFSSALAVRSAGSLERRGAYQAIVGLDVLAAAGAGVTIDPFAGEVRLALLDGGSGAAEDPLAVDPWPAGQAGVALYRIAGQLLLEAEVETTAGDGPALLLFDTGASRSLIGAGLLEERGQPFRRGSRQASAYGGRLALAGEVPRLGLAVGDNRRRLKNVGVIDLAARSRITGVRVCGFVGLDLLARHVMEVDLRRGRLVLRAKAQRRPGR
ncbi:MAG: hypothetical protein Q9Q40_06095 [Acidobacteriota bacterium]|nr:hypothetical protein [Acidobacteriota bacterium]MDQ7086632.1 hypothetical protein [Acidobacteriota bacterium]